MPADRSRRRQHQQQRYASAPLISGPSSSSALPNPNSNQVGVPTTPPAQIASSSSIIQAGPPPLAPKGPRVPAHPASPTPLPRKKKSTSESSLNLSLYTLPPLPSPSTPFVFTKPWLLASFNDAHPILYPSLYRDVPMNRWTEGQREKEEEMRRVWRWAYGCGWRVDPVRGEWCPARYVWSEDDVGVVGFDEKVMDSSTSTSTSTSMGTGDKEEEGEWSIDTKSARMGGPLMGGAQVGGGTDEPALPYVSLTNGWEVFQRVLERPRVPSPSRIEEYDNIEVGTSEDGEDGDVQMNVDDTTTDDETNVDVYDLTRLPTPPPSTAKTHLPLPDNSLSAKYFEKLVQGKVPDPDGTYWVVSSRFNSDSNSNSTFASNTNSNSKSSSTTTTTTTTLTKTTTTIETPGNSDWISGLKVGEWALPTRAQVGVIYGGSYYTSVSESLFGVGMDDSSISDSYAEWECEWVSTGVEFEEGSGRGQERLTYYCDEDEEEEEEDEEGEGERDENDDSWKPAHELVGVRDLEQGECIIF